MCVPEITATAGVELQQWSWNWKLRKMLGHTEIELRERWRERELRKSTRAYRDGESTERERERERERELKTNGDGIEPKDSCVTVYEVENSGEELVADLRLYPQNPHIEWVKSRSGAIDPPDKCMGQAHSM